MQKYESSFLYEYMPEYARRCAGNASSAYLSMQEKLPVAGSLHWEKIMDKVLCGANAQSMRYYFNEEQFGILPEPVREELKRICVGYCSDVGGVITMSFNDDGKLYIQTLDPIDDIGAELCVKRIQRDNEELFSQLEVFKREFGL